ncbi:MAG TPA: glycosyltransferase family 2 protein [Gammaproteobacteria bacterium]|jgi:glycosyltransferase involved in cell wall biosynthesis|nr:glycosyltransferase family 2 protein [Gammaproteobacteria bacterium]
MPKISACIISFNEEKKIEDCLKSLQPVVDEIIIVDSLSTDNTLAIAGKYTDRIFHQKFLGHIEQKNLAVSKAEHDWVLSLDCDERLTPELQQSILAIKNNLEAADAYCMHRKTFYVYRWLNHCWYPDTKTRLFNKNTAHWGGTNPHDRIITRGKNIRLLKGDIQHYSFSSISEHLKTIDKFTEIGADELIKKGKRFSIFSPLTHASWTFIKLYFIKRGFLDGFAGLVVSVLSYMHVFVKYTKAIIKRHELDKHENS